MSQQKSTRFSAAKVANFGVVMAEMVAKMSDMEKEIKRLRHHVSVLSKRNHRLVEDGKSRAAPPIASDASLSVEKAGVERVRVEEKKVRVEEVVEVVAESVASFEEAEVAEPLVKLPVAVKGEGSKKRRVDGSDDGRGVKEERVLIAPLGPRAECGGFLRRVGRESVFKDADPRYVAGGSSTPAAVGVSQRSDAWGQSPGASGGYQLRPRVGYNGWGYGGRGRGRGV